MEKIKKKIISIVIFLASIFLSFLAGQKTPFGKYIISPIFIIMLFILAIITILQYIQIKRYVRYSVMIYFLNENSDLLLVVSQQFKNLIIPSGMLKKTELPNMAVARILKEEVGIGEKDFIFDMQYLWHKISLYIFLCLSIERWCRN